MNVIAEHKPIIGISCGDINGIGPEIIIKTLGDSRMLEYCTPVIFTSNKVINFYRKTLPEVNFSFSSIKDATRVNPKQVNVYNCWEEETEVTPGQLTAEAGKCAITSLSIAAEALKAGKIDGLVTAPIHKKNIQSDTFNFTGHTPYLKDLFEVKDVAMFMVAENMRVALLTEHVPLKDVAQYITRENILSKLQIIQESLKKDFGINKPKIAVLALNPHAGDEGLVGKEEQEIIIPTIKEAKQKNMLCFG
ncbi:MAG: 4-hydroxythreonine-4-phosphate dehydrogenase PdxA, partial [Gloeobacteraceae cyanobacterium ES-bin-316]|nr:4-hydroxythreonine-4-phosphate dehydrogenase PdxA [Ferruginibacter sp.]